MPERDLPVPSRRPEPLVFMAQDTDFLKHILPAEELILFRQANRGELRCFQCEQPVLGVVMLTEEYKGLTLVCLGCGYCEY
jgi:hypothetical protein